MILLHATVCWLEVGVIALEKKKNKKTKTRPLRAYYPPPSHLDSDQWNYLFARDGATLHLPDAPHLLLHLLLLHQNVEVALLQLVLRLTERVDMEMLSKSHREPISSLYDRFKFYFAEFSWCSWSVLDSRSNWCADLESTAFVPPVAWPRGEI